MAKGKRRGRTKRPKGPQHLGNVRWETYSHTHMFNMVMNAHPNEVFARHRRWTEVGRDVLDVNGTVQRELDSLLKYWRGGASAMAAASSVNLLEWSQEAAETTQQIGQSVGDYGNALVRARNRMPQPRYIYSEAAFKDQDEAVGIVGGAAGASQLLQLHSDYRADREERERARQEAIDVMREFEQNSFVISERMPTYVERTDTVATQSVPEPSPVGSGGTDDGGQSLPPPWESPVPGYPPGQEPAHTGGASAGPSGLGQGGGGAGGGYGGAGGYGGLGAGGGAGAGSDSVHGGRNFAGGPLTGVAGPGGAGAAGGAGGAGAFGRGPAGMLAGQTAAEAAAARGAGGAGGAAGARGAGSGFFPPMAGAGRDDDTEKRVAPYIVPEDDLFDDDRPVAPPVFGA